MDGRLFAGTEQEEDDDEAADDQRAVFREDADELDLVRLGAFLDVGNGGLGEALSEVVIRDAGRLSDGGLAVGEVEDSRKSRFPEIEDSGQGIARGGN